MAAFQGITLNFGFLKDNVQQLRQYVYKYVEIETIDHKIHNGCIYTIDPESESFILVTFKDHESISSIEVIFGKSIRKFSFKEDCSEEEKNVMDRLFEETEEIPKKADELNKRKERLRSWLVENRLPVEEGENGVIRMSDVLFINPPYSKNECFSTNEIVLSKIQKLIDSMPS